MISGQSTYFIFKFSSTINITTHQTASTNHPHHNNNNNDDDDDDDDDNNNNNNNHVQRSYGYRLGFYIWDNDSQQHRQCIDNIMPRCICLTIVAVKKQQVLYNLSVYL